MNKTLAGRVEIASRLAEKGLITPDKYIKFLSNELTEDEENRLILKLYRLENEKPSIFAIITKHIKGIYYDIRGN